MMPNHRLCRLAPAAFSAAIFLSLAGCAQVLPITGQGAKLDVQLSNDATGSALQNWHVRKFDNAQCDAKQDDVLLSKRVLSHGATALDPIVLPTGNKITLGFSYFDAHLGRNMGCDYTVTFVPVEARHYTARFAITGNVSACTVAIVDAAGQAVAATSPVRSCIHGGVTTDDVRNGGGRVTVPPMPSVIYINR
jgi:hypothetical protein